MREFWQNSEIFIFQVMYFELQLTKQLLWSLVVYIIYETDSKKTQSFGTLQ